MKPTVKYILIGAAAIAVIAGTAVGSSYLTSSSMQPVQPPFAQANVPPPQQVAQAQPVHHRPACNDHNVVGTVAGAVGGGLVGSAFGHGGGRTLTTIGGAAAGGALGNAYIPTRGAACN